MTKDEKRLIVKALRYIDLIEGDDNQPLINEIRGILLELIHRK